MRIIAIAACAALAVGSVAAQAETPLQKETSVWQAFKDKNAKAFSAMLAPDMIAVYEDGRFGRAHELDSLKNAKMETFKIDNFASRLVDPNNMLMSYTVDVKGTMGKDDISGKYQAASLWHRAGKNWVAVYHTEIKAK